MTVTYLTYFSHEFMSLALTVFLLGIKHGFDADHLAAIDGLARLRPATGEALKRHMFGKAAGGQTSRLNAGILFTMGHGAVVLLVAMFIAGAAHQWSVPAWLEYAGAWISIATLFILGLSNLKSAFLRSDVDRCLPMSTCTVRVLRYMPSANPPIAALAIGALFAVSFDTLSQVSLFAMTATQFGGVLSASLMTACFVAGMLLTDGFNGLVIARLISRADRTALIASRVMTLTVALIALGSAAAGLAMQLSTSVHRFFTEYSTAFGALLIGSLFISSVFGLCLARAGRSGTAIFATEN